MQSAVDEFLLDVALSERGKELPDHSSDESVRLFYPLNYALRTWYLFRSKGIYPAAGGYNDQDAQLMDDWLMLDRRYLFVSNQLDQQGEAYTFPDEKPLKLSTPTLPNTAPEWTNL